MTTKVALCKFALIRTQEAIAGPSQPVQIVQHQNAIDPESIAKKLNEYWMPIWQKDTHDLQFVHDQSGQDAFSHILGTVPALPPIQMDMLDVTRWQSAINKLKTHSARGCDRISAQELKMLPTVLIKSLAHVMSLYKHGFPETFMT